MNNNTFIHKYIKPLIGKTDTVVDMTAGNGNDTLFLAGLAGKVIAFDISQEALRRSKEKTKDFDNIEFHHASHGDVDLYVKKDEASLFIFNLGYLPGSDEKTFTQKDETLKAFRKAYSLLRKNGYIIITFYLRQIGGYDEYYLLDDFIKKNKLQILEAYHQDKMDSPITYIIYKSQSRTDE